jgi:hypothetical protein
MVSVAEREAQVEPTLASSCREQGREAEMIQAIDRLRLIHNEKRKTVYILCKIPLEIPVDELVTWKQLTGDRRLSDALAECDERGWDALPLAAKEMTRLFPRLWITRKAAERWIAKNPLKAYRDIIRVWGVLNDYRPSGQTSWSKALVRHGADPAVALEQVLGVSGRDIRARDRRK